MHHQGREQGQALGQGSDIHGWLAPEALEDFVDLGFGNEFHGGGQVQGDQAHGHVFQDLHPDAAGPEDNHGTEGPVPFGADDDFQTPLDMRHDQDLPGLAGGKIPGGHLLQGLEAFPDCG